MKVVTPVAIETGTTLVSTNVGTGADPAAYNALTVYALADRVVEAEVIYASLKAANTGNTPSASPLWWAVVGPINSLAMFDRRIGTVTSNADTIEVTVAPGVVVSMLSMRGLAALTVVATQTDPVDGEVYTETVDMVEPVFDWYEYFFTEPVVATDVLLTGFLPYLGAEISVVIDNTGGTAECGLFAVGPATGPGAAEFGASDGITDWSRFEPDEWGVRDVVERDYADDAELMVEVPVRLSPAFRRLLASRRAQPTLLSLADSRPDAQYYGLISFRRVFSYAGIDTYSITVKGFT